MKVKSVKTRILEEVGFQLPTKKLLSPREKVEIMEQFLMMPASQIVTLQQDGRKSSFVQQIAKLLYNNNLGEYFNVLKMCRDMAAEEEENKGAFLK
jgi:SAM-dependent MidA family methyltransferase